ncbi:MAG: SGNH/GDSL hydrolase family protein [Flavobacteriaceae bacterium]|nr:SGNH/GDSL hydrolase family protein [Flavobacteriaceae bacterium]
MGKCFLLLLFVLNTQLYAQRILFVGNSLTYYNDMPNILRQIGKKFDKKIHTEMLCYPNYAIIDHLREGKVQQKIASEKYDYVIAQQGPSSQEQGRKMLINDGKKLVELCKKHSTRFGYFMVWPSKQYYFTFDKVIANHKEAAKRNNTLLFSVGSYWKQYEAQNNTVSLYSSDQFHPSVAGSFFAALTIFKGIYPKINLHTLTYNDAKQWIQNEKYFNAILQLLSTK